MSKLSDLQSRMRALGDIEGILNAMKNLSLVEMTKISRFYVTQQELLHSVEEALADFQQFYGAPAETRGTDSTSLYVLIGSERGFCGGFNETIQKTLESQPIAGAPPEADPSRPKTGAEVSPRQACCGISRWAQRRRGNSVGNLTACEDSHPILFIRLEDHPQQLHRCQGQEWKPSLHSSLPRTETAKKLQFPPLLNLPPSDLRPQLFEQYLFALFYGIFYQSFMAENHERLRHMDGALNKLREDEERLRRLSNSLRQESITEELEIIMLSVDDSTSGSLQK